VPREPLLRLVASALGRLGSERAAAVLGEGGLDEIGLSGPSRVAEWTGTQVKEYEIDPRTFGIALRPTSALAGGDATHNAKIVQTVLAGERGPHRDVVLLNAALALEIAGAAANMQAGLEAAAQAIDSGGAQARLDALVQATNA